MVGSRVQLGHHYQADSGSAGEAVAHGVGCVTDAGPLARSRTFAHGVGAAASVTLRQGQERGITGSQDFSAPTSPRERSMEVSV